MQAAMLHRGPDGAGEYVSDQVALAMRRLSIIDPEHGWQPLFSEDKRIVMVANGEIYNYVELRATLRAKGHVFATGSDCETIVHLYEDFGADCLHHLRGMFAIALWDEKRRRLILARDRMGEKPLYLFQGHDRLVFASEMKALLASGHVDTDLCPEAVDAYFHHQYVPEPFTPLRGVKKLEAGHFLSVDVDDWNVRDRQYWRMEDAEPVESDPASAIHAELARVMDVILRADVPVGVALSAGLDSSVIAALAARRYPGRFTAFSVGYPGDWRCDERAEARRLADYLGIGFHEIELCESDVVESFADLVMRRDDPIADISGPGYHAVSQIARENGVPVLLQGQGADELFWGYEWVQNAARDMALRERLRQEGLRALPRYCRPSLPVSWRRWHVRQWLSQWFGLAPELERFRRHREELRAPSGFLGLTADKGRRSRATFYGPFMAALDGEVPAAWLYSEADGETAPDILLTRWICRTYLQENGITQGERLSMANSVELRLPFVDYRLVETVIGLRKCRTDLFQSPKAWLKKSIRSEIPKEILRRPKTGFTPPCHAWSTALFRAYGCNLAGGVLEQLGVLNHRASRQAAVGEWAAGKQAPESFSALVLELWCRGIMNVPVQRAA